MWNPNPGSTTNSQNEDESWEVKAFAEDTKNVMGTTWPPRFYTCMFCKKEFRSAQALGGHMNVHRRDRARLHQPQPKLKNHNNISSSISSSALLIPTQELMVNGGLCLLYSLPKPNGTNFNNLSVLNSVPVSPHSNIDKLMNFQAAVTTPCSFNSIVSNSSNTEASTSTKCKSDEKVSIDHKKRRKTESTVLEGIDLELRLGYI